MVNNEVILKNSKIAIAADFHFGVHSDSSLWHKISWDWAVWFKEELIKQNIKDIIFCGDFFHTRSEIAVNTIQFGTDVMRLWDCFNIIMIPGNHCCYLKHNSDINSLSIFKGWKNVTVLDKLHTTTLFGKTVSFSPWGTPVVTIPQSDIVFGHFEIQSFKYNQYTLCNHGYTAQDLFKVSPIIISGHLHLGEFREYDSGQKIIYTGNPFQMDFGDIGGIKGYYILDLENLNFQFFENISSPKHYVITLSEMIKCSKITEEYIQKFKGNIIKFIIDRYLNSDSIELLLRKIRELNPLILNIEYVFNFANIDVDRENFDTTVVEISTAISDFINLMNVPMKQEVNLYIQELYQKCK